MSRKNFYHLKLVEKGLLSENHDKEMPYTDVDALQIILGVSFTGNGDQLFRKGSYFEKFYDIEKKLINGRISSIRLIPHETKNVSRPIADCIRNALQNKASVHSGLTGGGQNGKTIIDHKDGRYPDFVRSIETQRLEDFQPLLNSENLLKRQACKECINTGRRFDAKNFYYNVSVIEGTLEYTEKIGCKGCYWYDCAEFKNRLKL